MTASSPYPPDSESGITAIVTGTGPEVVLVHGALGDCRQWSAMGDRLRDRYTVLALSRRHHWPHPPPPRGARYSYETHRDDLLAFLRARQAPVHLVGHSWGAGVVLLAALREPARVRTLTLIEPALHSLLPAEAPGLAGELASRASMLDTVRARVEAGQDEDAARALFDWIQGGPGGFDRLAHPVQRALLENARTIGPTFSETPPQLGHADLHALAMPTLVVNGQLTRLYYRLIGETAASAAPGAARAVIDGAHHMTIVEQPQQTGTLMAHFLDRHHPAP